RTGNVTWSADPPGWAPYGMSGGPDLYYVRVHLSPASSGYTTTPVEGVVKTDILLLQYCGDVTAAAQTFVISPPLPTLVTLESFTARGVEGGVALSWSTASELGNLGFHLYRADAAAGPWTRITAAVIPGLGASPTGTSYSYGDTGLVAGITYFYALEDIDTSGGTTRHGPVEAVAGGPGDAPTDGGSGGGDGSAEAGAGGGAEAVEGRAGSALPRQAYGAPASALLRVLERGPAG